MNLPEKAANSSNKKEKQITNSTETIPVLIKFRIRGNLRFLSHAETLRLFQRACARARICLQYSHGYNPRPKLSLPLPRSVAVETEGDFLCLRVLASKPPCRQPAPQPAGVDIEQLKTDLASQLPDGCDLISAAVVQTRPSFLPTEAVYVLPVRPKYLDETLKKRIERVLGTDSIIIRRQTDAKGTTRNINVRRFLKSITPEDENIAVVCRISSAGSIRVEEILEILELDYSMLAMPIARRSIQWAPA